MALKMASAQLGTSQTTLFTVPSGKTARVLQAQVGNRASSTRSVTIDVYDGGSATANRRRLLNTVPIPANTALVPFGELVLQAGDSLRAQASAGTSLDIVVSYDET